MPVFPSNLVGQTLLNRFRVESFVAAGGMGAVYRVWDLQRSVYLAMKTLHADLADDPVAYRRFKREATDLQTLAHPHIVPFYGLFEQGGLSFLLEGYINGPSLKDILRQRQGYPLDLPEALAYLRAMCAALGYAHALRVVHCDVKPGNVMVDTGGVIYLADFGIARHAESTTTTLGPAGTPAYMAPEQIRGDALTPATDIYALGVVLFEMLTGRRPFLGSESELDGGGATPSERIRSAHLWLPPPDPRAFNPNLPPGLAAVVLRALAKDPAQRFATTGDLFEAAARASGVYAIPDRVALPPVLVPEYTPRAETPAPPYAAPPYAAQPHPDDAYAPQQYSPEPSFATPPVRSPYTPGAESSYPAPARRAACSPVLIGVLLGLALLSAAALWLGLGNRVLGMAFPGFPAATEQAGVDLEPTATEAPSPEPTATEAPAPAATEPPEPTATPLLFDPTLTKPVQLTPTDGSASPRSGANERVSPKDGMLLLRVPAGPFIMGSNDSPWEFEAPRRTVTLDSFWVDQTEVTNAMFERFVAETGYRTQAETAGWGFTSLGVDHENTTGADWRHPLGPDTSIAGRENYPVVQVSWTDARNYCEWAGRRLLTEAEWEKAARGEDGRAYPWGSEIDCKHANFALGAGGTRLCIGDLTAVDAYPAGASPYGALGMSGNVFEWVADFWQADYYAVGPDENPQGPSSGDRRVHRGGAFYNFNLQVQTTYRYPNSPSASFNSVGIRCGMSE